MGGCGLATRQRALCMGRSTLVCFFVLLLSASCTTERANMSPFVESPGAHHRHLGMDFEEEDSSFARFFDTVVIPAHRDRWEKLDPHAFIGRKNASEVIGQCSMHTNKRILEADRRVVILGAGPAGLTAAIYAARAGLEPLVISRDGGQLESTSSVDNFPGFADGVDAVDLLMTLTKQATKYGASFRECDVSFVDVACRPFRITCGASGLEITSSALIVAAGASTKWLGVPGELELLGHGVHTCATCDGYFYRGKHAAVIGGGDTAMEQALFLARMAERVTVIHRRDTFKASRAMASRVLSHPNIEILWDTSVVEFIKSTTTGGEGNSAVGSGDHDGLQALRIVTQSDESGPDTPDGQRQAFERILPVDGAFVSIGLTPNTQLFDSLKRDEYGYIYTVPGTTLTSITGVYAAGDVADGVYRQAITSAGTGAMAALDAERWLCEHGC